MLVRPTTDVDPGSEPDTDNTSSDKTRRDTEHHRIICNCNCNACGSEPYTAGVPSPGDRLFRRNPGPG